MGTAALDLECLWNDPFLVSLPTAGIDPVL